MAAADLSEVFIDVEESVDVTINDVGETRVVPLPQSETIVEVPIFQWKTQKPLKKWTPPLPPLPHPHQHSSYQPAKSRAGPTLDEAVEYELKHGHTLDPNIDERLLRRTISNRLAAKRSRLRRLERAGELESKLRELEVSIRSMKLGMEAWSDKKMNEQQENVCLKTAIVICNNASQIKGDETVGYQSEVKMLRELYTYQQSHGIFVEQSIPIPIPIPHNIAFYEQPLNIVPAAAPVEPPPEEVAEDSFMGMINFDDDDDDDDDDDEGVDQYLNLDDIDLDLNLDIDIDQSPSDV